MKKTSRALQFTLIALGLTLFAVVVAGLQASDEPINDEAIVQASLTPEDIPDEAKKVKNPYGRDPESPSRGKQIFSSQCTMCHGADGRGSGDLVARLDLTIPDFTNAEWQKLWSDGSLFYVVTTGHGDMPGQKDRFDDKRKWDLVNYVRAFAR